MAELRALLPKLLIASALLQLILFFAHPVVNGLEVYYRETHDLARAQVFSTLGISIGVVQFGGLTLAVGFAIGLLVMLVERDL